MISKNMAAALNKQINAELYSAYLYLAMSAAADHMGFKGTGHWLAVQAKEELGHATKFADYLRSVNEPVVYDAIAKPPARYATIKAVFESVLGHEKKVTAMIGALADLAGKEKDHATGVMLQWFVSEQVEEEENATEILTKIELIGSHGGAMYMLDRELGKREG